MMSYIVSMVSMKGTDDLLIKIVSLQHVYYRNEHLHDGNYLFASIYDYLDPPMLSSVCKLCMHMMCDATWMKNARAATCIL